MVLFVVSMVIIHDVISLVDRDEKSLNVANQNTGNGTGNVM